MKTRLFVKSILSTVTVAVMALIAVMALVAVGNPQSASADTPGGILVQQKFAPLLSGTVAYTTSPKYSATAYVAQYGSVNVMVADVVTGSQTITVTPQFSLQDAPCGSVTQWFTATDYVNYQPYSVSTSSTLVTETLGAWQALPMVARFTIMGSNVGEREFSAQGTCMRVKIDFSDTNQSYTPTVIIRALNRN